MSTNHVGPIFSRRRFLSIGAKGLGAGAALASAAGWLASCSSRARNEVVLYSSVDEPILRPILRSFEQDRDIKVRAVTDTEATKSTGLIERLLAEQSRPRADVWWSSEPLGVVELARAGALEPFTPSVTDPSPADWPSLLRDPRGLWFGFALRARVIAYSSKRVAPADVPATLGDLTHERFHGRVGIADAAFGTTRVHLAALVAQRGEHATRAWLAALKQRGLKVFAANSAVVRAISEGEIDVGLTDTDDVHAGKANGWEVGMAFEATVSDPAPAFSGGGSLVLPNTVARVKGGPNSANAVHLINYILSAAVERQLADSESRNTPIRKALLDDHPDLALQNSWVVDANQIADALPAAAAITKEILGPR